MAMTNDDGAVMMAVIFVITVLTILLIVTIIAIITVLILQRKDFPSNSFYVVVVVKTEDQACGGSLPFYPFVEGTFCALGLARGGRAWTLPGR